MNQVIDWLKLRELCDRNKGTLLYASYFGSTLYGTSIAGKSDIDIKGIYLPDKEEVLTGFNINKSITYSTGKEDSKNSSEDIDVQLWSLQYYLKTLLPQGDTGGLDLLFSVSNDNCIIFKSDLMDIIFNNYDQFVNCKNQNAYIGYCIGQAKKYGIKGSKLGIIKQIKEYLDDEWYADEEKLSAYIPTIMANFYHPQYCFTVDKNDDTGLVLCGRMHMGKITLKEFHDRLIKHYEQYGEHAKLAMENKGIDWKALSHAVRCLYQVQELIDTGKIQFPLKCANELIKINQGKYTWEYLEKLITTNLELVNLKLENVKQKNFNYDFADTIILNTYSILEKQLEINDKKQELLYFNDHD